MSKIARLVPVLMGSRAAPWYLAGGIPAANCVAAYKAIGAASLAASYVNLANPGTYDLTTSVAPTFSSETGWTFNGSTQQLHTGITPATGAVQTWSLLVRFSGATSDGGGVGFAIGSDNGGGQNFVLIPRYVGGDLHSYCNGTWGVNWKNVATRQTSGVMALAGGKVYLNGASDGTDLTVGSITGDQLFIGGNPYGHFLGAIQAAAIYNIVISAVQAAATYTTILALV